MREHPNPCERVNAVEELRRYDPVILTVRRHDKRVAARDRETSERFGDRGVTLDPVGTIPHCWLRLHPLNRIVEGLWTHILWQNAEATPPSYRRRESRTGHGVHVRRDEWHTHARTVARRKVYFIPTANIARTRNKKDI